MNDWTLGLIFILVVAVLLMGLERLCRVTNMDIDELVKAGIMIASVGAVIYYLPLILGMLLRKIINAF